MPRRQEQIAVERICSEFELVHFDSVCVVGIPNVFSMSPIDQVYCGAIMQDKAMVCRMWIEYERSLFRRTKVSIQDQVSLAIDSRLLEEAMRETGNALRYSSADDIPYLVDCFDDVVPWLWFSERGTTIADGEYGKTVRIVATCTNFQETIDNLLTSVEPDV